MISGEISEYLNISKASISNPLNIFGLPMGAVIVFKVTSFVLLLVTLLAISIIVLVDYGEF